MAEKDNMSELTFRGQLGVMGSLFDLKGTLVDTGIISMVCSKNIIPGVESVVCEFSSEMATNSAKSHDFGILSFEYYIGLGTNFLSRWLPGYNSYQRDNWEAMISELKKLPSTLVESSETNYSQGSTTNMSSIPKPKVVVELPQSLIRSSEFLGPNYLEWLKHAALKKCPICDQLLKTGEDVSILVNMNTQKLSCSTGINNGVYHVSHTPCLISWIMMSDFMIECGKRNRQIYPDVMIWEQLDCVMCPDCQGSEGRVRGENPRIALNRLAILKTKTCYSYKEWLESQDESSDKRDIGLSFPISGNDDPKMEIRKRLHIYKAG